MIDSRPGGTLGTGAAGREGVSRGRRRGPAAQAWRRERVGLGAAQHLCGCIMSCQQQRVAPPRPVLIVEDNPDGRESLMTLLRLYGFHVEGAADGAEGVA